MSVLALIGMMAEIFLKAGGPEQLRKLLEKHDNFVQDVTALRNSLRRPKKTKGT